MGQVDENTGYGRVTELTSNGWMTRIQAWCGKHSDDFHDCFDFGPINSTTLTTYGSMVSIAHNSGRTAWLAAHPQAFIDWFNALPSTYQDGIFEAARFAGQYSLTP